MSTPCGIKVYMFVKFTNGKDILISECCCLQTYNLDVNNGVRQSLMAISTTDILLYEEANISPL